MDAIRTYSKNMTKQGKLSNTLRKKKRSYLAKFEEKEEVYRLFLDMTAKEHGNV